MSDDQGSALSNRATVHGQQLQEDWASAVNHIDFQREILGDHSTCANAVDHVVVATVDCLTNTFTKELEEWGIPAGDGKLIPQVKGEVATEGQVDVIRRIHVEYLLKAEEGKRETAERIHGYHAIFSPLARSLSGGIEVTTALQFESA